MKKTKTRSVVAPNAAIIEYAAEAAHEVNRTYCQMLDDYSQRKWLSAPSWRREAARDSAAAIIAGRTNPAEVHEAWVKQASGRGLDPRINETIQLHPSMRPWSELPRAQQAKSRLFVATVQGTADAARRRVMRASSRLKKFGKLTPEQQAKDMLFIAAAQGATDHFQHRAAETSSRLKKFLKWQRKAVQKATRSRDVGWDFLVGLAAMHSLLSVELGFYGVTADHFAAVDALGREPGPTKDRDS